MALSKKRILNIMRHSFPSWTDIRKRTNKSVGGKMLTAYSNEFDKIQEAIDDYKKIFFLLNYLGHEDEYPEYLYIAAVGIHDNISITNFPCKITKDENYFYKNFKNKCALYEDGYLMFHESSLPEGKDTKSIIYSTGIHSYEAFLFGETIWNIFDEFATFAGLTRFEGETNKQLSDRIYKFFKEFPTPTEQGLKNAIKNAIPEQIADDDIEIIPINDSFDLNNDDYAIIYEAFAEYNHDLFRTKRWGKDLWENNFQKTNYLAHAWDEPMGSTIDGVGYNDSLKVDYLKHLSLKDSTDIVANAYKKDFEKIRQYIGKSNIKTTMTLQLEKYSSNINPKVVEYRINATNLKKIDPRLIYISATKEFSGESRYWLEDIATHLYNVTRIENGVLESNASYQLKFTPHETFSGMSINRCTLNGKDLRKEYSFYSFKNGVITNTNVAAHITKTSQLMSDNNIVNTTDGLTVGHKDITGKMNIDVESMDSKMITYDSTCRLVDITSSAYVEAQGFSLNEFTYSDTSSSSAGQIRIGYTTKLSCNAFSFVFDAEANPQKQGSIIVTTTINGHSTQAVYTSGCTIKKELSKRSDVAITIQKYGMNPIRISNIKMASYDIDFMMSDGTSLVQDGRITRLPKDINGRSLLVKITPYSSAFPTIRYIHIGASLSGARYELDFNTNNIKNPVLDIDTDCDVTLYKIVNGKKTLVGNDKEYTTKDSFVNNSSTKGQIIIDVNDYQDISDASKTIQTKYKGTTSSYIELEPGESLKSININGTYKKRILHKNLGDYLFGGSIENKEVYVFKDTLGYFLTHDTSTKKTEHRYIDYKDIGCNADSYTVDGLPNDVSPEFIMSDGQIKEIAAANNGASFKKISLNYKKGTDHVAYNSVSMFTSNKKNIEMVNTFTPIISFNQLYYYTITPTIDDSDTKVVFGTSQSDWSFGVDPLGIEATTKVELNNVSTWNIRIDNINSKYILANEVPLEERYRLSDNTFHNLMEFIVTPEKGLKVLYEKEKGIEETSTISSNLIVKLQYSNIEDVDVYDGKNKLSSGFKVMGTEGIVVWNDGFAGKTIRYVYTVNKPSSVTYTKEYEDKLYDLVSYKEEAYRYIGKTEINNLKDGETRELKFNETPDRIVTKCSNVAFEAAVINNSQVTAIKIKDTNKLAVHNGYIYDHGLEYYYFNDRYIDKTDQYSNIEFHDTTRKSNNIMFHMRSTNYLPYSNMRSTVMADLCSIDFTKRIPKIVSKTNHYSACEDYNLWYLVNMKLSIVRAKNGYGILFNSKTKDGGYGAFDITKVYKKNNVISFFLDSSLTAYIVKEELIDGIPMPKSVFIDMDKAVPFKYDKTYKIAYIQIKENAEYNARYYIVIEGNNGIMDDLLVMENASINIDDIKKTHTKNINSLNFRIDEQMPKDTSYDLDFDKSGAKYNDLVIDSSTGEITTSSDVEYGLTKIAEIDLSKCQLYDSQFIKNNITLIESGAYLKTPEFSVYSRKSVYALYVKVNDIITGRHKGFTIRVWGKNVADSNYMLLAEEHDANLVLVSHRYVKNYIYIEVLSNSKTAKEIYSIEAYARYAEYEDADLAPADLTKGEFVSKIYDMGTVADYRLSNIDAIVNEKDNVSFYVRGLREGKNAMVFTPWKKYTDKNKPEYTDYSLFQFKIKIDSPTAKVKVNNYRMEVV